MILIEMTKTRRRDAFYGKSIPPAGHLFASQLTIYKVRWNTP